MRQKAFVVILAVFLVLVAALTSYASEAPTTPQAASKAFIILVDNITWADIIAANDPTLNKLIQSSAIGIQNNRPLTSTSRPKNALSVGACAKADLEPNSQEAYNSDEPYEVDLARDAYKMRTGYKSGSNRIVEVGIPSVIGDNQNGMQNFTPGFLADTLKKSGKNVAVFGNADTSLEYEKGGQSRVAAAIGMDSNGTVKFGDVGKKTLIKDPNYPFGLRTNYDYIDSEIKKVTNKTDLVVVELADTVRIDEYGGKVFKSRYDKMKNRAIHDAAVFIEKLINENGDDALFVITTLSPPGTGNEPIVMSREQMTPIIIHGPGFQPGGIISDTTNRKNLVAMIDIGPTILSSLGLLATFSPSGSSTESKMIQGSTIRSTGQAVTPQDLDIFNRHAISMRDTRKVGILTYIYMQLAIYLFAAVLLAFKKMLNKKTLLAVEIIIFTAMSYPLFSFYTTRINAINGQDLLIILLTILVSLVLATALIYFRRDVLHPIIGVTVLTVLVLGIDIAMGAPSIINSIFGYDTIRGARYFGIGNEAVSMLVANTLLIFGVMLEKSWSKWVLAIGAVMFAVVTVLIGFPGLGTNTDGPISTVAAFSTMMLLAMKSKNKARNALITVVAMASVLALFGAYDIMTGPKTHIGKSILLILNGGISEVLMIVNRKLGVNLTILRFSTWSYFLVFTLGVLVFLWYKPVGLFKRLLDNYKGISASISAAVVGGIVGFAFNDSGILVPAIIMSYIVPTVLYLMLWEQYRSKAK